MSIETLLEAAKFLELQAQQQQKTREETEFREKLCLEQDTRKQRSETASVQSPNANHMTLREGPIPECHPRPPSALLPPLTAPPSIPITVIPIPVVSTSTATPTQNETHSPLSHHTLHQCTHLPPMSNGPKTGQPLQPYIGSVVKASQHALLSQSVPTPTQLNFIPKSSPPDDHRGLDSKKRPGGAGTREVHNKLEKNRRAHLKECFETLKKNIPNVDEKKTSNLSVLRSALRYVQTLKRKEKEYEHEMERLAREKISTQQRLADLKNELSQWMDMIEIERLLRQTVQPEDDQASTSTASEGEDNIDEGIEKEDVTSALPHTLPRVPHPVQPELRKPQLVPSLPQHISVPATLSQPQPLTNATLASVTTQSTSPLQSLNPQAMVAPQSLAYGHIVATPSLQQTVITHAASHASVIQAVNHGAQTGPKHITHIAPSSSSSSAVQIAPGSPAIGHITVHPVAHLPALYPQPVTISHTLSHSQANGTSALTKQTPVGHQVLTHHPQLVGQTVLNPVTMVTMPSFPVSTLKLA